MKLFQKHRLAYFEDLEDDPESKKVIEEISKEQEAASWVPATVGRKWIPSMGASGINFSPSVYFGVRDPDIIQYTGYSGGFTSEAGDIAFVFYNKKYNAILYIMKDATGGGSLMQPENLDKIKTWCTKFLLEKRKESTVPMSEVLA